LIEFGLAANGGATRGAPDDATVGALTGVIVGVASTATFGACRPHPTTPNVQPANANLKNDLRFILHLDKNEN
jgi:hypothetical protein